MEKYVLASGVVSSIADDMSAVQSAHAANLDKRLRLVTQRTGILMDSSDAYALTWHVAEDSVTLTCSDAQGVVWPDYQLSSAEDSIITRYDRMGGAFAGYLMLSKSIVYDEAGTYAPNYPVDPGTEANNTRSNVLQVLTLHANTPIYNDANIPLYQIRIGADGNVAVVADLRVEYCYAMVQDLAINPPPLPRVPSVHSRTMLSEGATSDEATVLNVSSSLANAAASHVMLDVEWQPAVAETDIWAYDVRCRPYTAAGAVSDIIAFRELVMPTHNGASYKVSFPAVHGVMYSADVRSISIRSNRLPSEWCLAGNILAGADWALDRPATPTLDIQRLLDDPLVINLHVEVSAGIPKPYKIQIFKRNSTIYGIGYQEQTLIYEGADGDIQTLAEASGFPQFRARLVCAGMLCSEYSAWQSVEYGTPPTASNDITRYTITMPVAVKLNASDDYFDESGTIYCGTFYPPKPGVKIVALDFISTGSYEYRYYPSGGGHSPCTVANGVCLEVAPQSGATEDLTSRLYCAVDGDPQLDICGWFYEIHGVTVEGPPSDSYEDYHRHWYVTPTTHSYTSNKLSEQVLEPDVAIDVNLAYDIDETQYSTDPYPGCIIMIAGVLTITLEPML